MIDSHCHLDRLDLKPHDGNLEVALERARAAGVTRFLCISINLDSADPLLQLASKHSDVDLSVGMHPLDDVAEVDLERLTEYARRQEFIALGETGLDYYYSPDNREQQIDSFVSHLRLGSEVNKPVVVHSRDAKQDTLELIDRHGCDAKGVLHCFTGDLDMARSAIDLGYYISFSGILTFANAQELRDVARELPLDRVLIETDSPYLAPVPFRGRKNEPQYLPAVAECLAQVRQSSIEEIVSVTTKNYYDLFGKPAMAA